MSENTWEKRALNRVLSGTLLTRDKHMSIFGGFLEPYGEGSKVVHNGAELEEKKDFEVLGDVIKVKIQISPNDKFGVSPRTPAEEG